MAYDQLNDKIQNSQIKKELKDLLKSYLSGEPFFTKATLEDAETRLRKHKNHVKGTSTRDPDIEPSELLDGYSYAILYRSIQRVVSEKIKYKDGKDLEPVHIGGNRLNIFPQSQAGTEAVYQSSRKAWLSSQTFLSLKTKLDVIIFPIEITKIVCFGLGSLVRSWANTQHAAVESLIGYFKEKTGHDVCCYAQDPGYSDIDEEFLKRTIGIDIIEDPKGFLEVDENTFVISISPDVPVKQIVSDLQRPAAMLWITVGSMEDEIESWEKIFVGSTWTSDPDSPRLRMLVENYVRHPFPGYDDEAAFKNVTLYVRKP